MVVVKIKMQTARHYFCVRAMRFQNAAPTTKRDRKII